MLGVPAKSSEAARTEWLKRSAKAKSVITLGLRASVMAQVRIITNDDMKIALELWNKMKRIYTASNEMAIRNIRNRLDTLVFE